MGADVFDERTTGMVRHWVTLHILGTVELLTKNFSDYQRKVSRPINNAWGGMERNERDLG